MNPISSSTRSRHFAGGWLLVATLASGLAPTATASGAALCLATSTPSFTPLVLSNARLKKGKVNPVVGYLPAAGGALPLSGVSIVSADGTSLAIALEMPRVSVASGGVGNVTPADSTFRALFVESDRSLDIGDTSSQGLIGGVTTSFTVIACNTAPPFP